MAMAPNKDNRTLGELFTELTDETSSLLRQEVRLAKVELAEKISQAERGIVSLVLGGALAFAGFLALVAAAIIALSAVVQWWLASLIVGGIVALIGIAFISRGREDLKAKNLSLNKTTETLQEDKQWAKAQMR